ncbi:DUF4383 domain-containing protein [Nocardioides eburneiflavus]|uniref:DUF4383 domain-containing protein n=1 Tax=Nocardioides eburneiflavus TaxID=2518372 RepID=A0A4Z1CPE9_9ACTN|nr:DUF4383 domain-containing protein [Nocardioides eburneiflavus]
MSGWEGASRPGGGTEGAHTPTPVGAVLLLGVLGFIPGTTTSYDGLEAAGHRSHAELLGIFQVSVLHDIVHLLLGAAGLALARTAPSARGFLVGGGATCLVPWLYGLRSGRPVTH